MGRAAQLTPNTGAGDASELQLPQVPAMCPVGWDTISKRLDMPPTPCKKVLFLGDGKQIRPNSPLALGLALVRWGPQAPAGRALRCGSQMTRPRCGGPNI